MDSFNLNIAIAVDIRCIVVDCILNVEFGFCLLYLKLILISKEFIHGRNMTSKKVFSLKNLELSFVMVFH